MVRTPVTRISAVLRSPFVSIFLLVIGLSLALVAQDQTPPSNDNPNKQETPPEAGGPQNDVGPYAIPKKKEEPPAPPPERPKKVEGMPDYSIRVDVPLVNVDVMVTTKEGQFIPGMKKENFKVYEDGVQQNIVNFNQSEAPITAVMLIEFASTNYYFMVDALNSAYTFAGNLKKNDWVAVESYDMKPHILVDFTQDKRAVMGGLGELRFPGFAETNLFDALYDTLDRLDRIEGRKYVILISTGVDTFSKLNLDQILKKVKTTKDVTIFPVSVGRAIREYMESHGRAASHGMGIPISNMDYLQADNQLNTFAKITGGRAYFPRFQGELPEIFHDITSDIHQQYSLSYHPTNAKLDGTYRKLKVDVTAPDGGHLKIKDQHGKDVKFEIIARDGYTAKHTVD